MTSARHRNKTCELRHKHGTTLIGTRRPHRRSAFCRRLAEKTLSDASLKLDEPSLTTTCAGLRDGAAGRHRTRRRDLGDAGA